MTHYGMSRLRFRKSFLKPTSIKTLYRSTSLDALLRVRRRISMRLALRFPSCKEQRSYNLRRTTWRAPPMATSWFTDVYDKPQHGYVHYIYNILYIYIYMYTYTIYPPIVFSPKLPVGPFPVAEDAGIGTRSTQSHGYCNKKLLCC